MTKSDKNIHGYIYCITNKLNGGQYVGLTTKTIEERFAEHKKANSTIGKAIREHGAINFVAEQIDVADNHEDLCDLEVEWIDVLETHSKGYNDTIGGEGVVRAKLHVELTKPQKRYIEYLKDYNEKHSNALDKSKAFERLALHSLAFYFMAEYKSAKVHAARVILNFPEKVREYLFNLNLIDVEELKDYAK